MEAIQGLTIACDAAQALQRIGGAVQGVGGFLHPMEGFVLYWLAKHWPIEGAVVEIGSFKGLSTSWLAHGCKEGKRGKVIAVDHFTGSPEHQPGQPYQDQDILNSGSTLDAFRANIAKQGLQDFVIPRIGASAVAVNGWSETIRMLFIDGDHSYEASKLDFDCWSPFVPVGGLVLFHDIGGWPGVTQFLQDLTKSSSEWRLVAKVHSLAVVQRATTSD